MTDRARSTAAVLCFACVAPVGYALHRLGFWLAGEPAPGAILHSVHISFYWRVATAAWWGLIAAAAGWRFPSLGAHAARAWPAALVAAVIIAVVVP